MINLSSSPCSSCGGSPAWAFPRGVFCVECEHNGEIALLESQDCLQQMMVVRPPSGIVLDSSTWGPKRRKPQKPRAHPEADFQQQVIDLLHLHHFQVAHFKRAKVPQKGGKWRWITPVAADGKGFPDLIAVRDVTANYKMQTQAIAWELKDKGNKATPEQLEWLRLFSLAGFHTAVWWPHQFDEIAKLLEDWK